MELPMNTVVILASYIGFPIAIGAFIITVKSLQLCHTGCRVEPDSCTSYRILGFEVTMKSCSKIASRIFFNAI